ncbi:winged helix-turn-helix domain-containing protein [Actinoplanes sp. Pm04-4]|uniref:Winged helix-turn-helix domain-containing protein n=1 Tax=Paractinoplanes pyxinae TaxID=2997416 RepID=A0ABT4B728_9ACTN|nr:winged helix-turn-helix domain-containing protein [Actinoplanes pyxinae]MCY1141403.1 winged helix-turn-helix domain-containing protein [Actinoplanes pyxinae]
MPVPPSSREIADDLTARIRSGEYPLGSKLPTLREMAGLYSVSVSTIQRALDRVDERGLIISSQGRGTFVVDRLPQ